MIPDIVIHHHPCPDGFTSAWAFWRRFGDKPAYHPGVHGEAPPDVTGKNVVLVDFSYKRPVLDEMAKTVSSLLIIDHHKSAAEDLKGFGEHAVSWGAWATTVSSNKMTHPNKPVLGMHFDMNHSGAGLAWKILHPLAPVPELVAYVEDRDLWRFAKPLSREVNNVVTSYDYDFGRWNELDEELRTNFQQVVIEGEAIERANTKTIHEMLPITTRTMKIGGVIVQVANMPYHYASDAANLLAANGPMGATYFDSTNGRVFSLRSLDGGLDVSEIAKSYGGGGHKHAAGFTMPHGWCGDT